MVLNLSLAAPGLSPVTVKSIIQPITKPMMV